MKIKDWNVLQEADGSHEYRCDCLPLENIEGQDRNNKETIPYEEWKDFDFAEISERVLEHNQYSKIACLPKKILEIMINMDISEKDRNLLMKNIAEGLENE